MTFPTTIKALISNSDGTASVGLIPLVTDLQPYEILIRVRSVGLNPLDWKRLARPAPEGVVMGFDAAGDIIKVGSEVKHLKVGDRVSSRVKGVSSKDNGAHAEYARLVSTITFKVPDTCSYNEAASLPTPHLTAVMGLYNDLQLPFPSKPANKEDIILIWGGSTAVGHQALQLAVQSGWRVFVAASTSTHEYLKGLGVERCFEYRDEDIVEQIKEAAGSTGVSYAYDAVSEGHTSIKAVDAIRPGGGKVIITLPHPDAAERRADVEVKFVSFVSAAYKLPHDPEVVGLVNNYLKNEFPFLVEGWKEGEGSSRLKPQRLRVLKGGLEKITDGLNIVAKGEYGREKLVYPIA